MRANTELAWILQLFNHHLYCSAASLGDAIPRFLLFPVLGLHVFTMGDDTPLIYDIALAFFIVILITFILYKFNIQRTDTTQSEVGVANGEVNSEELVILDEAHDAKGALGKDQFATLNEPIDLNAHGSKKEVDDEDIISFWDGAVNAHLDVDQVKHRMTVIPTCVVRINMTRLLGLLADTSVEKLYI